MEYKSKVVVIFIVSSYIVVCYISVGVSESYSLFLFFIVDLNYFTTNPISRVNSKLKVDTIYKDSRYQRIEIKIKHSTRLA